MKKALLATTLVRIGFNYKWGGYGGGYGGGY
jgi:hypothetical protein